MCTFARINMRDMHNGFKVWIKHFLHIIEINAVIKKIANIELFQVLITVELFIIGIDNGGKFGFVFRKKHWLGITTEIRTCHSNYVHFVPIYKGFKLAAESVIGVGTHVMKFINRNEAVIKSRNA